MELVTVEQLDGLDKAASEAAKNSYSPYSDFPVGSALLTADGTVVHGCNVESASYGLSLCSERCAMVSARALGHVQPHLAISVVCPKGNPTDATTVMPCGACRQVMSEMLAPNAIISVVGVGRFSMGELLPTAFKI